MRIYKEQDTYDYEKFPHTSERKRQFIVSEGGRKEKLVYTRRYHLDSKESRRYLLSYIISFFHKLKRRIALGRIYGF